jgi:biotin carboxyl carrier protein
MKLQAEIGQKIYEVEIDRDGVGLRALIDGEAFEAEISEPEPNVFLIRRDGKVVEAFVDPGPAGDQKKRVWIEGREHSVRLIDPTRLRGTKASAGHDHGVTEIRSAMPGKIVRILLETGAAVEKGAGVLVVEAMKMQNELKAPKSGTVKTIKVSAGDTVSANDVLAVIE